MRRFELTFNTNRGSFRIPVDLETSTSKRESFRSGVKTEEGYAPIKQIRVLPNEGVETVTSVEDISRICEFKELCSLYEKSDGTFVHVPRSTLANMFPSNPEMRVVTTISKNSVPMEFIGSTQHFLNLKMEKKGKTRVVNPEDQKLYSVVCNGLKENNEVLLVRYTANNTNKFGIVFVAENEIRLRIVDVIPSNHQKESKVDLEIAEENNSKMYDRLVKKTRAEKADFSKCIDDYSEKLDELVKLVLQGKKIEKSEIVKSVTSTKLSALEEDSEDEEEKPKIKKSMKKIEDEEEEEIVLKTKPTLNKVNPKVVTKKLVK